MRVVTATTHQTTTSIPAIWKKAAGLWRNKKVKNPVAYQKRLRRQWEKRLEDLV